MEWAIVYGALCTVTDCAFQKIARGTALLGLAAGGIAAVSRILQGTENGQGIAAAVLPAAVLWGFCLLTEGKIGRGDGMMLLTLGLLLGWRLCAAVLGTACLLIALFAGIGLAAGKYGRNSRIPFAPFLLAAMAGIWVLILGGG